MLGCFPVVRESGVESVVKWEPPILAVGAFRSVWEKLGYLGVRSRSS